MIALAYSVPTGVAAGWSGVLDMVLTPAKVSQVIIRNTALNPIYLPHVIFNVQLEILCVHINSSCINSSFLI